ncbi:MAG: hypothetical protein STSR0008_21400 [Ignavibacterium sp.]
MNNEEKSLIFLNNFSEKLKNFGYIVSLPSKGNYFYEIIIRNNKEKVQLKNYFGKKGTTIVLEGNKDLQLYKEINDLVYSPTFFSENKVSLNEPENYIGIDESGKGDYFGPLVIAGVYVDKDSQIKLKELNVRDSKVIDDQQIIILSIKIKEIIKNNFEIVQINPDEYNRLYDKYHNLNKLLANGHTKVLENLFNRTNCENVIIDKFTNENLILSLIKEKQIKINTIQETEAEKYVGVAAASILAREKLILWFNEKNNELGVQLNKGASNLVDEKAKIILQKFGKEKLYRLVKLHFKNTQKILS